MGRAETNADLIVGGEVTLVKLKVIAYVADDLRGDYCGSFELCAFHFHIPS